MRVIIGNDHVGLELKNKLDQYFKLRDIEIVHLGTFSEERMNYPEIAFKLSESVINDDFDEGIHKHIGIYSYSVKDLCLYMNLPQSNNEISLSLEQYRFLDNKLKISAYRAVSDPGISVDSLDNLNELKGVNN